MAHDADLLPGPDDATLRGWLLDALQAEGLAGELHEDGVLLDSGLAVDAQFGQARRRPDGNVSTSTRTLAWHDAFPEGLMEYQHAAGKDVAAAVIAGFRQWARLDLAAIADALPGAEQHCLRMDIELPAADGAPAHRRRVVHGPTARHAGAGASDDPGHPFCPCCMFAQGFAAFQPLLEGDEVLGLRLYAARNDDGSIDADCRVNGEDYPPGVAALREYAATWRGGGFEFRKQYLVVCTPGEDDAHG